MRAVSPDILQEQEKLGRRLLRWGALSVTIGTILCALADRFWKGFGSQTAGWGLIDAAIGWLGVAGARKKAGTLEAHTPDRQKQSRDALRRVLWINAGLDVGYVAGGLAITATRGRRGSFWRGSGWSIIVQAGFLLLFDLLHALQLRATTPVERTAGSAPRDQ